MGLVSAGDPHHPTRRKARLDESICLGCGVCVRACSRNALRLRPRARRVITPVNTAHRVVQMAIERGLLQNLIFDNQAHRHHRAMAAVLGVILKLPPLKQALASRQIKSRYLEWVLARREFAHRDGGT
jgi:ferredoxin